jgi:hypothetical protein
MIDCSCPIWDIGVRYGIVARKGCSNINVLALAAVCRFLALGIDMHRRAFIALGGGSAAT